jgi:peroxiredoxin
MVLAESSRWRKVSPLRAAPNFNLQSVTTGNFLSLNEIEANSLIIAFLPGVWAPWCRKFLNSLNQNVHHINDNGAHLVAIISQDYDQLFRYAKQVDLHFEVLADTHGVIGKRFGVFDEQIREPMKISKPSIFILDRKKRLRHTFIGKYLMDIPKVDEIIAKATEPQSNDNVSERSWLIFRRPIYAAN